MIAVLRRAGVLALLAVALIALGIPAYSHLKAEYEAYVTLCLVMRAGTNVLGGLDRWIAERTGDDPTPELQQVAEDLARPIQDPKDWLVQVYLPDKLIELRFMLGRINRSERLELQAETLDPVFCQASP